MLSNKFHVIRAIAITSHLETTTFCLQLMFAEIKTRSTANMELCALAKTKLKSIFCASGEFRNAVEVLLSSKTRI